MLANVLPLSSDATGILHPLLRDIRLCVHILYIRGNKQILAKYSSRQDATPSETTGVHSKQNNWGSVVEPVIQIMMHSLLDPQVRHAHISLAYLTI
jgi:hypothetical protein